MQRYVNYSAVDDKRPLSFLPSSLSNDEKIPDRTLGLSGSASEELQEAKAEPVRRDFVSGMINLFRVPDQYDENYNYDNGPSYLLYGSNEKEFENHWNRLLKHSNIEGGALVFICATNTRQHSLCKLVDLSSSANGSGEAQIGCSFQQLCHTRFNSDIKTALETLKLRQNNSPLHVIATKPLDPSINEWLLTLKSFRIHLTSLTTKSLDYRSLSSTRLDPLFPTFQLLRSHQDLLGSFSNMLEFRNYITRIFYNPAIEKYDRSDSFNGGSNGANKETNLQLPWRRNCIYTNDWTRTPSLISYSIAMIQYEYPTCHSIKQGTTAELATMEPLLKLVQSVIVLLDAAFKFKVNYDKRQEIIDLFAKMFDKTYLGAVCVDFILNSVFSNSNSLLSSSTKNENSQCKFQNLVIIAYYQLCELVAEFKARTCLENCIAVESSDLVAANKGSQSSPNLGALRALALKTGDPNDNDTMTLLKDGILNYYCSSNYVDRFKNLAIVDADLDVKMDSANALRFPVVNALEFTPLGESAHWRNIFVEGQLYYHLSSAIFAQINSNSREAQLVYLLASLTQLTFSQHLKTLQLVNVEKTEVDSLAVRSRADQFAAVFKKVDAVVHSYKRYIQLVLDTIVERPSSSLPSSNPNSNDSAESTDSDRPESLRSIIVNDASFMRKMSPLIIPYRDKMNLQSLSPDNFWAISLMCYGDQELLESQSRTIHSNVKQSLDDIDGFIKKFHKHICHITPVQIVF